MADISKALKFVRSLPPAENSRLTQIATTGPSYRKALSHLERAGIEGRAIDYGAGRGHGLREIGADTFEPYPQGWSPTYTKPEEIPDEVYRRLVNLNVLNVLDPQARESAVLNMGRIVEPGGGGVISTRGRDVMSARGEPGPEPMSLIIGEGDQARYQKGFTPRELREYVGDTLGSRFDVEPSDVGQASIMFRRNREDGGLVPQQDAEDPRDDFDRGGTVAKALRTVRQMMERSQDLPAEQRMMVVHKTRLPALEQYERLGGLPVPSTAVVKTGEPLTNFGDVTLVGNPEILAKPSERNPIFASDVYSPRMPDIQGDKKQFFETYNRYGEPTRRPATIGSLVSNMRGNVRGGENFGATEGAVRAQITPQFRSVAELDAARGRLSQAAYDEAREAMRGRGDELFARIGDLSRNPRIMDFYGDMEGVARIMRQYGNQSAEPLAAYMTKRYNVGNDEMADVIRYVRDLRDMPSPYFEGKPQRAVPFTDFSGALIPEGRTARDTADLLNRQGVRNIEFYSPKQDLGGGEAERALSDALIERFPQQQFADGGAVDYNDAPNYALDAETSRFNMGDVFAPLNRSLSQGKNPARAENIPLARPVAPPEPDVVNRALGVVRAEPRPMDIKVSRQAPPPPRPVPRPAPRPAPAPAAAAPDTSESRRLWDIYNETGNPADFVRASNAMRAVRAEGGEVRDGYDKGGVVKKALKAVADLFGTPEMEKWRGKSVIPSSRVEDRYFTGTSKDKDFANFNVGRHGVWLTKDPAEASMYALQNDSMGYRFGSGGVEKTNTASRVIPVFARADNPYTGQLPDFTMNPNYKRAQSEWFDQLRSQGHDAWLPENNPNLAVILRDPEQIKSAISNTGEFSGPRIDRAEGGRLLEDEYPTHYLPNVGRQVMADGGSPAAEKYEAMPGFLSRWLGLSGGSQPEADIQQYESRMRAIAQQPEDIRSMTHAPSKPMRPIEIEGGFIGKRQLGEAPYDVAGPLSGMAQTAYSLKTLPFYFTPAFPLAAAADFGEAAIDTAKAAREGDYLGAGITGALGVAMPGYAYRKPIGDVVGRALNVIRGNPAAVGAGAAGAAVMAPEEAEASKLNLVRRGLEAARGSLPMDEASRMARAEALNFNPTTFYHGTSREFPAFDTRRAGEGATVGGGERAVFLVNRPAVADSYLGGQYVNRENAAASGFATADMGGNVGRYYTPGSQVMPLRVRGLDQFTDWDFGGGFYTPDEMAEVLKHAKKEGAPGAIIRNVRDPGFNTADNPVGNPRLPSAVLAVRDPSFIRSVFARFDPEKITSKDLLAGGAGIGALGASSVREQEQ